MARVEPLEATIMNPRRYAIVMVAFCGTIGFAGWVGDWRDGFSSAAGESSGAVSIADRLPLLAANAVVVDTPPATAIRNAAVAAAASPQENVETAAEATMATDAGATSNEPDAIREAALPAPSQMPPPQAAPVQVALASMPDPASTPLAVNAAPGSIEIVDECLVVEICIDRYLWALYERTPKLDTIKEHERRKVTVKRRGKMVTVSRTFTKLVDEDFTWKDPKAADKFGMSMQDYVIGGMDRGFKLKLFHMLHAAQAAGLSPGITSAFRDDYRQEIASGMKAASNRSYHGGSLRGGYGHGLAADVVSVNGATKAQRWIATEAFWKWIDAHGSEFGIARPYLDRDPPHVGPIDGKEYADHRGTKAAALDVKKRDRHSAAASPRKRKIVEASKLRTT
jgi:hypothetical protein